MGQKPGQATDERVSLLRLLAACAVLAGVLVPVAGILAWFASWRSGSSGALAAAYAGGVCFVSASLALATIFAGQRLGSPVGGILGSMVFRMGLPLAAVIALGQFQPSLARAGGLEMILGLYLVTLVVETMLSLKLVPRSRAKVILDVSATGGIAGQ